MASFFITTVGWFAWIAFLDAVYAPVPSGKYAIRDSFSKLWGGDAVWWATLFIVLGIMGLMELLIKVTKRNMLVAGLWQWPPWNRSNNSRRRGGNVEEWGVELWQELEQEPKMRKKLARMARDDAEAGELYDDDDDDDDVEEMEEIDMSTRRS